MEIEEVTKLLKQFDAQIICPRPTTFGAMLEAIEKLLKERDELKAAGEMLWVVIANVSGGDWSKQSEDWQEAASRWRDNYFKSINEIPK